MKCVGQTSFLFVSPCNLRTRVAGAKKHCESLPDTHVRRAAYGHAALAVCILGLKIVVSMSLRRRNLYDNQLEYWVVIREKGQRKEQTCEMERTTTKEANIS